jgi:hypothetical protein
MCIENINSENPEGQGVLCWRGSCPASLPGELRGEAAAVEATTCMATRFCPEQPSS